MPPFEETFMSLDKQIAEMFQFSNEYYMGVNIFIMTTQFLSILANGFIMLLFVQSRRLRRNTALRLILLLCVTDWIFAWSTIPYMLNYVINWTPTPTSFNYDGILVITLSLPLTIQFKVNLVITSAIALDRFQAMRFSFFYRTKNHNLFVVYTLIIGVLLSLIDVYFEYKLDPLPVNKGCAAVGCFTSLQFRWYWGATNMTLSFVLLVITGLVWRELRKLNRSTSRPQIETKSERNVEQANRLAMAVLVVALVFQMVPSMLVGISDFFGLNSFQKLGPFYIVGLLLCGLCNAVVYVCLHLELQAAARRLVGCAADGATVTTVTQSTASRVTRH